MIPSVLMVVAGSLLGYLLGEMGYPMRTWQFWAVFALMILIACCGAEIAHRAWARSIDEQDRRRLKGLR